MAIIETTPDIASTDVSPNPWRGEDEYPTFAKALGSGDHKTLGRVYIGFALLFAVAAWVLQALSDTVFAGASVVPDDAVTQVLTLSPLSLVLLAVLPLLIGLATLVVPLQVGANTIAFPRAAALALWSWVFGAGLLLVSYALNGGVAGGDATAVDLSYLALAVVIVSLMLATVCLLTTVVALRAPGMHLDRVPFFAWSVFIGGSLWLLTLPALLANIVLIYVDVHYGRPSDFGVGASQWGQLDWAFSQPQVFVYAVPALGIVADSIATITGVRQKQRGVLLGTIAAFGILSFGVYAQTFFNPDLSDQILFIGTGIVLGLPLLIFAGGVVGTLRASKLSVSTPVIGSVFTLLLLLLGALASLLYAVEWFDFQTELYRMGVLALVGGATLLAAITGLHLWWSKFSGRTANDNLGKLVVLVGFGATAVASLPLLVAGTHQRFSAIDADVTKTLFWIAAIGAAGVALTALLAIVNLAGSSRGALAADNPWSGQTLEWTTSSPPAPGNFGTLAEVTSAEPLLDIASEDAS